MQSISCYDIEAEDIEQICIEKDITEAELIEGLMNAVRDGAIDIDDWV